MWYVFTYWCISFLLSFPPPVLPFLLFHYLPLCPLPFLPSLDTTTIGSKSLYIYHELGIHVLTLVSRVQSLLLFPYMHFLIPRIHGNHVQYVSSMCVYILLVTNL